MADSRLDVAGCGSMVVDLYYRTPRIIGGAEKIALEAARDGTVARTSVGGVVLNHLGWARVLGLEVGIFGKIGDDSNGALLRRAMERLGIRQHLTLDGSASSFAAVFVDSAGNRAIYMARGASAELRPAEIRNRHSRFIGRARLVSTEISQLPLATVVEILSLARARAIPTVLDVDLPPAGAVQSLGTRKEFERALKLATILKPAKAAAQSLAPTAGDALEMACAIRSKYKSRAVFVTDGGGGCAVAAGDGTASSIPAFAPRRVVDRTGAGDAFMGGMLAGLRWGLDWPSIGRLANAAGAVCIGRLGAFPPGFEVRGEIETLFGQKLPAFRAPKKSALEASAGDRARPLEEVERFFELAIDELARLRAGVDLRAIGRAAEIIRAACERGGRVHITGVGKPEHVARYAASLLCSVGTPATFLHATEALHGGLGQVRSNDVVVAISNSGTTDELCRTARAVKEHGAQLIAVTGNLESELSRLAEIAIMARVGNEGGVLGLAPRVSVLGEVYVLAGLSVALEAARGLTVEEYSRWHRAGALGEAARRLACRR